ncbi:YjbF family lipoprotein [Roseomonas sp. OT10]|uniref:YjbF family lipoprotein n=1 Tax=Roseomonas cutis TaxID=2897332 RepID=UPI001E48FFAD|nr:YjbF family lipoprotein [Roseomonas sp. OT10]UFN47478.1 YjbF family lipoprotein [Roseomonas sp. OT10]
MRRTLLLLLPLCLPLGLAGCGDTPFSDVLRMSLLLPPLGPSGPPQPEELAPPPDTLPPATESAPGEPALLVSIGSRRATATLLQQNGEQRLWRSASGLVVATDGARVVATAGLPVWLTATRLDGPDPLDDPGALAERPAVFRRSVDLMRSSRSPDGMRFGVSLECRLRAVRQEEALLIEERCGGGASFTNRYWAVPETGSIWRSEQWVGGDRGLMVIEVLTPPAS